MENPYTQFIKSEQSLSIGQQIGIGLGFGVASVLGLMAMKFKVCKPEQVMVRTGIGIKDMIISKKGMEWPFQKAFMISMVPRTHSFNLHNMSKEKVEFKLPVTFTTAPVHPTDDHEGFKRYARFMNDVTPQEFQETLGGMIEGEMRVHTATMTIEEMFSSKEVFQESVVEKIGLDLNKIGIRILNANVKEMSDFDDENKFFIYRKQRAIQTAVAEAQKKGEVGMKGQETERRIEVAKLDKNSTVAENERKAEIAHSQAQLGEQEAESKKRIDIANVEADMAAKQRKSELEQDLYIRMQEQELERRRAEDLTKAKVGAESMIATSEGEAKSLEIKADAELYREQKKAEGIQAVLEAQAEGLQSILKSTGDNPQLAQFYLALDKDLYPALAKESANAVRDMKPKFTIWNTGSETGDPMQPIIKTVQSLSPLLQGIQEQGGITIPKWMPQFDPEKFEKDDK